MMHTTFKDKNGNVILQAEIHVINQDGTEAAKELMTMYNLDEMNIENQNDKVTLKTPKNGRK
jgi:hypothetical protein